MKKCTSILLFSVSFFAACAPATDVPAVVNSNDSSQMVAISTEAPLFVDVDIAAENWDTMGTISGVNSSEVGVKLEQGMIAALKIRETGSIGQTVTFDIDYVQLGEAPEAFFRIAAGCGNVEKSRVLKKIDSTIQGSLQLDMALNGDAPCFIFNIEALDKPVDIKLNSIRLSKTD